MQVGCACHAAVCAHGWTHVCALQEPSCVEFCPREQLQRWYSAAEGAYRDAQALRQMKTDSAVFNTFMLCQVW